MARAFFPCPFAFLYKARSNTSHTFIEINTYTAYLNKKWLKMPCLVEDRKKMMMFIIETEKVNEKVSKKAQIRIEY